MSPKDSMLDGFMKGLGKKLGTRRREVHQAIERFNDELHKDEPPATGPAAPKTGDVETTASTETESTDETKPPV